MKAVENYPQTLVHSLKAVINNRNDSILREEMLSRMPRKAKSRLISDMSKSLRFTTDYTPAAGRK